MNPFPNPIYVTRPYLPPLDEYKKGLEEIWENQWLTNNGSVLKRFHASLSTSLGVPEKNLSMFNNSMPTLKSLFKAMAIAGGEVLPLRTYPLYWYFLLHGCRDFA